MRKYVYGKSHRIDYSVQYYHSKLNENTSGKICPDENKSS